jgi:secreted PhoX family phosphatase
MAAFSGDNGSVILICNHEIHPYELRYSPFGRRQSRLDRVDAGKIYDAGGNKSPALGGTTTIHYDPVSRSRTHMHMSLIGTENNCAGGATPWGSWLSCEECFFDPGTSFEHNNVIRRDRKHGYIFEVPAAGMEPVTPVPLKDMGRFEHEAAAVNPASGYVYLSEDRHQSLLYRFVPNVAGKLAEGGSLQALAIVDRPGFDTRNWLAQGRIRPGTELEVEWVDLDDADVSSNDLRFQGYEKGAAVFARGEGLHFADGTLAMTATIGGAERLGQIFTYRPSPAEGTSNERENPGRLTLFAESTADSVLRHADNLAMSPWGDLVICEDTADHCGLVGIRPDGTQYLLADNAYTRSELAGICFSPDGRTMFLNIQVNGMTLAVTGPWTRRAS